MIYGDACWKEKLDMPCLSFCKLNEKDEKIDVEIHMTYLVASNLAKS